MLEHLGDWTRTDYCGDLRAEDIGRDVVLMGWVQSNRDHGGVIFIDLRDREGLVQVVFSPQVSGDVHEKAGALRDEWVLAVRGKVTNRSPETVNKNLPSGEVEVVPRKSEYLTPRRSSPFSSKTTLM